MRRKGRSDRSARGDKRKRANKTNGLSPSGLRGFSFGFADSEPVRGRFSVGCRWTLVEGGGVVEGDEDEGEEEKGHILKGAFRRVERVER